MQVDIVSVCDDGYLRHFAVLLHSASLFHPDATYWLLAYKFSPESLAKIERFAASRHLTLRIIPDFEHLLDPVPLYKTSHISTYARLLLPDLLPGDVDRILYIDADTTVIASLDPLFEMDLAGKAAAAVPDLPSTQQKEKRTLGLPPEITYCNAGVLLVDSATWREEALGERMLSFARDNPEQALFMDQSVLNKILAGRIALLAPKWNYFDFLRPEAGESPAILHYTAGKKPWLDRRSPFRGLYNFHRDQTPWPSQPIPFSFMSLLDPVKEWLGASVGLKLYERRRLMRRMNRTARKQVAVPALAEAKRLVAERADRRSAVSGDSG